MRVAIIAEVYLPKVDGVVNRTLNLIQQLTAKGDEVVVVCPEADGARKSPVPVIEFPSFSFPLYPEYRIGLPTRRLVKALDRFAPEVLHYINPFAFGFRCYDLLHREGFDAPCVFSFHTLYGEFVKQYKFLKPLSNVLWWLMREYHNRADMNMTVSSVMQDELVQRGFQRVKYWPPAVDGKLFHPSRRNPEMRSRLARGHSHKQLLLTVSRLAPEKNVSFLRGVLDRFPDACLAVVGDGPYRAELERQFAGRNANFIGYLKGVALAEAYASADAFVYASETETMGNVVLEAMASGCPVVAPRAGGIPSLVEHGTTGLLYEPRQLEDAVRATGMLLTDNVLRSKLSQAAREVVAGWDWAHSIEQVREVYRESIRLYEHALPRVTVRQRLAQTLTFALVSGFNSISSQPKLAPRPQLPSRPRRRKRRLAARRGMQEACPT
jgi:glycosyltransferase involved in cell wall biosynthesis